MHVLVLKSEGVVKHKALFLVFFFCSQVQTLHVYGCQTCILEIREGAYVHVVIFLQLLAIKNVKCSNASTLCLYR